MSSLVVNLVATVALVGGFLTSCSTGTQAERGNTGATTAGTGSGKSTTSSGSQTPDSTDPAAVAAAKAFNGEKYFAANIEPVLTSMCEGCHVPPRIVVSNPGPRTIFSYTEMLAKLNAGPSSSDNALISKVTNKISHSGGDQCKGAMTASPCKDFKAWGDKETAKRNANVPSGGSGAVKDITVLGVVAGWAQDPSDATKKVDVKFYVGGPSDTGTLAGTTTANTGGYVEGNHGFSLTLPPDFITNSEKQVWAYLVQGDKLVLLAGSPMKYTAYKSSVAGTAFYEANVKPQFQSQCSQCHGAPTISAQFANLVSPPKHLGGTATTVKLVIKGSGGDGHGGGNRCGGANAGLCAQVQLWWAKEFGP